MAKYEVTVDNSDHKLKTVDVPRGESYLEWGGKNFAGSFSPIDASMISELGANRFAFGGPNGVEVEYSRDGGNTWTVYPNPDIAGLFSTSANNLILGNATSAQPATTDDRLRVTITTDTFGLYTTLNKFCIYISTSGSGVCHVSIDVATQANPNTYINRANDAPITGWGGYNIINTGYIITYGSTATQHQKLRFTFRGEQNAPSQYTGMRLLKIMAFGGVGWSTPSTMAKTGHLYDYDKNKNVTFPHNVNVSNGGVFVGNLQGAATSATTATTASTANSVAWNNVTGKPSVATLGSDGKILSGQLPSYVDDVLEYNNQAAFPSQGESGKIYIAKDTNQTYRWGGSSYVIIGTSLALGETSSTAYAGDKGKANATAIANHTSATNNPHSVTKTQVGLSNVGNYKAVSTVANQGLTDTEKSNARSNIGAGTSSFSGSYNDLSNKPTLATVATSGSYNDLSNKPTIPAAYTHPATHPASMITGLATVATTGSYTSLSNRPSIPNVGDGKITIQKNGSFIESFGVNQENNVTINIPVPTRESELAHDMGYLTSIPTHTHTSNQITKMTSYSKPSTTSAITTNDSLNAAIGKLEARFNAVMCTQQQYNAMSSHDNNTLYFVI